jgi:hypothetical protein
MRITGWRSLFSITLHRKDKAILDLIQSTLVSPLLFSPDCNPPTQTQANV